MTPLLVPGAAQRELGRSFNEELNSFVQLEFSKEDTRADPLLRKVRIPSLLSPYPCTYPYVYVYLC